MNSTFRSFLTMPAPLLLCCSPFFLSLTRCTSRGEYGQQLAAILGADADIVEIAALLHDYASVKDQAMYKEHHLHGPREAESLLQERGYPPATILAVKECIASHRASTGAKQRTKEAICLAP